MYKSLSGYSFSCHLPVSELLRYMVNLFFLINHQTLFQRTIPFHISSGKYIRVSTSQYPCQNLLFFFCILLILAGEGNGNLLQYSCLENPTDRGAC